MPIIKNAIIELSQDADLWEGKQSDDYYFSPCGFGDRTGLNNYQIVYDSEKDELIGGLKQAQLLLIGHFYANREAVTYGSPSKLPLGFEYIIQQHKSYDYSKANNGIVEVEKDKWIEN